MKLRQINYDDDQYLSEITVTMSRAEAIALVNIAGQFTYYAERKLGLEKGDSLYDCLAGVFNGEFEEGYPSLGIDLKTLNDNETNES